MTELDTDLLRRALRASPDPAPAVPDALHATEIISRGRRLRWRRRAMAAGGGVCLAAAVFGAVAGIGRLTAPAGGPGPHRIVPVGPAGTQPPPRSRPTPSPRRDAATPAASVSPTAIPTSAAGPVPTPTPSAAATTLPSKIPVPTSLASLVSSSAAAGSSTPAATPSSGAGVSGTPTASPAGAQATSASSPTPTTNR